MSLTVNLWSRKEGELKRFLRSYYERDVEIADDAEAGSMNIQGLQKRWIS